MNNYGVSLAVDDYVTLEKFVYNSNAILYINHGNVAICSQYENKNYRKICKIVVIVLIVHLLHSKLEFILNKISKNIYTTLWISSLSIYLFKRFILQRNSQFHIYQMNTNNHDCYYKKHYILLYFHMKKCQFSILYIDLDYLMARKVRSKYWILPFYKSDNAFLSRICSQLWTDTGQTPFLSSFDKELIFIIIIMPLSILWCSLSIQYKCWLQKLFISNSWYIINKKLFNDSLRSNFSIRYMSRLSNYKNLYIMIQNFIISIFYYT